MPIKRCQIDGKPGWKWGDHGTCYTGPDGKKRAAEQAAAAYANGYTGKEGGMERLGVPFEFKEIGDTGTFRGYAAVFNNLDEGGDRILPGAFTKTLKARKGAPLPLRWGHSVLIGAVSQYEEDSKGLHVTGEIMTELSPTAKEAHGFAKAGVLTGMSIGYTVPRGGATLDIDTMERKLSAINLHEVTITDIPMNERARIVSVKSIGSIRELEEALRDAGFSRSEAKAIAALGYEGLIGHRDDAGEAGDDDQAVREGLERLISNMKV